MKLTQTANKEWGSKARKREERQSNLTHSDAHRAIQEELAAIADQRVAEQAEADKANAEDALFWVWHEEFDRAMARDIEDCYQLDLEDRDARGDYDPRDWTLEIDGYADLSDYSTDIYAGTAEEF